jgi:hypothetical protein
MQQVEACEYSLDLGYKGETCEPRSVLATGVRPMSWWPWLRGVTLVWVMLRYCKSRCFLCN